MGFIDELIEMGLREKVDRLYLEKCQEVNGLTERLRGMDKRAAFLEGKLAERSRELTACKDELRKLKEAQEGELISRTEAFKAVEAAHNRIFAFSKTLDAGTVAEVMSQYEAVKDRALELISEIPAVSGLSAAERLHEEVGQQFIAWQRASMAAEPLKPLEGVLEQPVTAQEILCLSSALRNLYEIHKCDGWLLYNKLAKVLERAVDEYSGELGVNE